MMSLFDLFKGKKKQAKVSTKLFEEKESYTEDELLKLYRTACDSFNSSDPEDRKFFEEVRGSEALRLAWLDDKRRKQEFRDSGIHINPKKTYIAFNKFLAEEYSK